MVGLVMGSRNHWWISKILEQKSLECHVDVIGVPEIQNEICSDNVVKIASTLGLDINLKVLFAYHQSSQINLGRFQFV